MYQQGSVSLVASTIIPTSRTMSIYSFYYLGALVDVITNNVMFIMVMVIENSFDSWTSTLRTE